MTTQNGRVVEAATVDSGSGNNNPQTLAEKIVLAFGDGLTMLLLKIGSVWIYITGSLFDSFLKLTVIEVGDSFIKEVFLESVETLWKIFRDFGNLIIIFSLLFLAIKTIFNGDGFADRKILGGVLLAAIFINFSLFFTKLVFDISNIASISIINNIGSTDNQGLSLTSNVVKNFSFAKITGTSFASTVNDSFANRMATQLSQSVFGFILMFVTGCIFLAACLFLCVRFLIFLLLMMTSPIGFIGKFIPMIDRQTKKWWDELWKQAIALPVFCLMLYVAFLYIQNVGNSSNLAKIEWSKLFTGDINDVGSSIASMLKAIFSFLISLGLLIAAIIVPGMVGGAGSKIIASGSGRVAARVSGSIGRNTFGAGSRQLLKSKRIQEATALNMKEHGFKAGLKGMAARATLRSADNVGNKKHLILEM
jgi:hypothetical protein